MDQMKKEKTLLVDSYFSELLIKRMKDKQTFGLINN